MDRFSEINLKSAMENEIYESSYRNKRHFSFGKNWQEFLQHVDTSRIEEAERSLVDFLGGREALTGKTFIDIGCGSGLFSLAAIRLGAKRVVSIDVDDFSLACAEHLSATIGQPKNWEIRKASALDPTLSKELGTFDIVYSWGVLHHCGDMYQAFRNIIPLVGSSGHLYIALYNENRRLLEGTSSFWVSFKRWYNQQPLVIKRLADALYTAYYVIGLAFNWVNPITYISRYRSLRGMSFMTDIRDWLGGHPYEYATVSQIREYFEIKGFRLTKSNPARSIGCNEFLFEPAAITPSPAAPEVSILTSVHNGAKTLDRCLESLRQQTFQGFAVVAVNDASTDATEEILKKWQTIFGSNRFHIITNSENLGLTLSLNRGLEEIHSEFTARIDADDWWEPTKIESQLSRLHDRDEIGVLGCNYENHRDTRSSTSCLPLTDAAIRSSILRRNPFAHSCVIFRTALVKKLGSYDPGARYGQDYELWLRLLPYTRFANLETVLCHRSVERGISATRQREQMRQGMKTQIRYIRKYRWPFYSYLYLTELFILSLIPDPIRKLKQRFIP